MTPVLEATEVVAAGGPTQLIPEEYDLSVTEAEPLRARLVYGVFEWEGPTYGASIAPARLTAVISRTDEGYVAECPEVKSLGYGPDEEAALDDLADSIREYLRFLDEEHPPLGPEVAHHSWYLNLLSVPARSWFAAIRLPPAALDAS